MRLGAFAFILLASAFAKADIPIGTAAIGPTPEKVDRPCLAAAGDGYLAFWPEGDPGAVTLRGVRLDATGGLRGSSFDVGAADFGVAPLQCGASDGASAFLLWQSYAQSGRWSRHMARVDADGAVTLFSALPPTTELGTRAMGAAAGGGNVMVVYADDNHTLTATLLDRNGTLLRSRLPVAETGEGTIATLDVAWVGGDAFILGWIDVDHCVRFARLLANDVAAGNVTFADANPRLSWNGHDYLLAWQRQAYYYEPVPYLPFGTLINELFAQRFTAGLTSAGAEIALQTVGKATAVDQEITRSGGLSLVSWHDSVQGTAWARIDDSGARLDPLNGSSVTGFYSPALAAAVPGGWLLMSSNAIGWVGLNGAASQPTLLTRATAHLESLTIAQLPLFTYKRTGDPLAYIGILPQQHRRTSSR